MGFMVCEIGVGEVGGFETLYTACRATLGNVNRYVVAKKTKRAKARHVAFYCGERLRVVPMFEATPTEKKEMEVF
jgi:hypothetical protein